MSSYIANLITAELQRILQSQAAPSSRGFARHAVESCRPSKHTAILLAGLSALRRVELAGTAQIGVDARLPTLPGRPICVDDISVEPQFDCPLRPFRKRATSPLATDRQDSLCQLLVRQFRRFFVFVRRDHMRINLPQIAADIALALSHCISSSK